MTGQAKRDTSECPNPKGMTVEFGEDVVQAHAWRLKGVGAYGSDVDVVSVELYRELAHHQQTTMETLTRWAESSSKHEKRADALAVAGEELCEATRTLSGMLAQMPGYDRLQAALTAWDDAMADRYMQVVEEDE